MVEAGHEFDREIRLGGVQPAHSDRHRTGHRGPGEERHRLLGALKIADIVAAAEINRQAKGVVAGQVRIAGRNGEDDGIEPVEPVKADLSRMISPTMRGR